MSNSIWKMPDQKPEDGQHILFFAGGGRLPYLGFYSQTFDIFEDWKAKDIQKWASVLDLIAQADKAERLQKELEALKEFITKLYLNGNITDGQLERYKNTLKKLTQENK